MELNTIWRVLFFCFHFLCYNETLGDNWKLSKKVDMEIERQLKTLNKPAVKTIKSKFGVTFDCVDFHKQPAFDHLLLKNFTSDYQMKFSAVNYETSEKTIYTSSGIVCPTGTVPIRRYTKEDLIREKRASKAWRLATTNDEASIPIQAVARTKQGSNRYTGAVGFFSAHNPKVIRRQFTASRLKILNGPDWIEAGWRVDESMYFDSQTHFYLYTHAGESRCFTTYCPGFVVTNPSIDLDFVIGNISQAGGPFIEMPIYIVRDSTGNWNLQLGPNKIVIGYWPGRLFEAMKDVANYIEWGGIAYLDPRDNGPQMGTGEFPTGDPNKEAYVRQIMEVNEAGEYVDDADKIEAFAEHPEFYRALDKGNTGEDIGHIVFYGGPGLQTQ